MNYIRREPTAIVALIAAAVQFFSAWFVNLSVDQQAGINAVSTLTMGLVVAWSVARDQVIAVAVGLLGAVAQLAVAFGAHLSEDRTGSAAALLTVGLALWLHGKVTAPVAADGSPVPRVTASKSP